MCYPCTECNRCGKFNEGNMFYRAPGRIPCFQCGGEVDGATGVCLRCGASAYTPPSNYKKKSA